MIIMMNYQLLITLILIIISVILLLFAGSHFGSIGFSFGSGASLGWRSGALLGITNTCYANIRICYVQMVIHV